MKKDKTPTYYVKVEFRNETAKQFPTAIGWGVNDRWVEVIEDERVTWYPTGVVQSISVPRLDPPETEKPHEH